MEGVRVHLLHPPPYGSARELQGDKGLQRVLQGVTVG